MIQYERQQRIIDYLTQTSVAKISELARHLYTSEASIRRDIAVLENAGLVTRVYGGVMLSQYRNEVLPAAMREELNTKAKDLIAKQAAQYIHDGETILFDNSSTVRHICKYICDRKQIKIITNSLSVCNDLKNTNITVYCTGGEYFAKRDCFLGPYAESFLQSIHADSCFFSCKGLSDDGLLTDVSEKEVSIRKRMLQQSVQHYFLCDSSKIGNTYTFQICNAEELTKVIQEPK